MGFLYGGTIIHSRQIHYWHRISRAVAFVAAMIFLAIEQFPSSSAFIVLVVTFCIALVACLLVVFQIDSWRTFVDGLQFWRWLPYDTIPENERHFVAQKITRVRKRAMTIARECAMIAKYQEIEHLIWRCHCQPLLTFISWHSSGRYTSVHLVSQYFYDRHTLYGSFVSDVHIGSDLRSMY